MHGHFSRTCICLPRNRILFGVLMSEAADALLNKSFCGGYSVTELLGGSDKNRIMGFV